MARARTPPLPPQFQQPPLPGPPRGLHPRGPGLLWDGRGSGQRRPRGRWGQRQRGARVGWAGDLGPRWGRGLVAHKPACPGASVSPSMEWGCAVPKVPGSGVGSVTASIITRHVNKSTVALGLGGKGLSNSTPSPAAVYAWVAVLSWNRAHFSRRKSPSRKHLAESQGLAQLHQGCASVSPLLTWRTQDPWGGEARPGPPPGLLSWAELAAPLHQGP